MTLPLGPDRENVQMWVASAGPAGSTSWAPSAVGFEEGEGLAIEATTRAINDAGLSRDDIDGLVAFVPDEGSVGTVPLQDALGIEVTWFAQCDIGPSQFSALFEACSAVETGRARHVVAFHASIEGSTRRVWAEDVRCPARRGACRSEPKGGNNGPYLSEPFLPPIPLRCTPSGTCSCLARPRAAGPDRTGPAGERWSEPNAIYRDRLTMEDYFAARITGRSAF